MNINSNYTITLGNRNIVKIMKGSTVIWEKSTTPVVTPDYFYIKNVSSGDTNWLQYKFNNQPTRDTIQQIEYSYDKQNWTTVTLQGGGSYQNLCSLPAGGTVYLRNNNGKFNFSLFYLSFKSTVNHEVGGNIYTLLDYTNPNVSLTSENTFENLFENDLGLVRAENLTLGFDILNENCYSLMFKGCSNLTTAPSLPATTLATGCYAAMFSECTSLTTAPSLPATTVAPSCYGNMFYGCTSLTTAPSLPATTVVISSYSEMFEGCTSLTSAPALPATSLGMSCYYKMFSECTSLTTAPSLPATTLAPHCYDNMFRGCSSLTTAPALPATTLVENCYSGMFLGCTSLTTTPALPATTLAQSCYNTMFVDCTSLTTAPELPATTLVNFCYAHMFRGCTSLKEVITYANDISAIYCINRWLENVAATGTFYNNGSATYTVDSESGIPVGWTEVKPSTGPDYFYLENVDSASGNVSFKFNGTPRESTIQQIEYSKDKTNWTPVTLVENTTTNVPVSVGEKVYFRNSNGKCSINAGNYLNFNSTVSHKVGGDPYTLLDYTNDNVSLPQYAFARLFDSDTKLIDASDLVLRWTTLVSCCYYNMFQGCTSLTTTPTLPATTLANQCYTFMFQGCTSLTTTPTLPATTLANQCYQGMFYGCTSLTTTPELPATTLVNQCYQSMFYGCTSLTTTPELPATTLASSCYFGMFQSCTSLNSVTTYADDISAFNCLSSWLSGVASTGTLHNYGSATYQKNSPSGIPRGWTEDNPFYIKNVDNFSGNVSFTFEGTPSSDTIQQIEWSKDRNNWTSVTLTANTTNTVSFNSGEKVYFRNSNGKCSQGSSAYLKFGSDKNINIGGNIYTLLDYTNDNVSLPQYAFANLFIGNTKLLDASKLVLTWTTLSDSCYQSMFGGCTSLTTAPELPATTLTESCYYAMFQGCTSLTTAPKLPATTLTESCYYAMFQGCTSLTTAPKLPATTLSDSCYNQMFYGCTSLNEVTTYADDISATDCLTDWLSNVATTGNFYNYGTATYTVDSESGIPVGWTEVKPTGETFFYIENVDSQPGDVEIRFNGTASSNTIRQIEWSKNKEYWTRETLHRDTIRIPINPGENVYFRNSNGYCSNGQSNYLKFTSSVMHKVGGQLYTLINYTDDSVPLPQYAFYGLFINDDGLIDASDLVLGWTTLANNCYRSMFQGCTSLTTAPSLPATTLTRYCYREMFTGCFSLDDVTIYADDISAGGCLTDWLKSVASTGTFHNLGSATYPSGASGIPRGWTEVRS